MKNKVIGALAGITLALVTTPIENKLAPRQNGTNPTAKRMFVVAGVAIAFNFGLAAIERFTAKKS